MQERDWLSLVAVHSDAWLLSVAFYFGARFGFYKTDRERLFNMINDLPTIFEVVTGSAKKHTKEKSLVSNHSSKKSKSKSKALKLRPNIQKQCHHRMRLMMVSKRKMRMSMERHYVGLVGRIMQMMNSGFAVISVRNGSMENV
ncbi:hypothetical protein Godav_016799 [Gossypium davidsonii]|uniref:PHD finger protein ALFIN-LIKE n=2 Tax=Gossypium TaxID=3633 RepID=A0A7J8QRB0_GOSDV|nr:hypothetical protein [Gossypium davidsonii]MBA0638990.1 hypothetical protein [Gossypium klotzschianum]